MKIGVLTTSYPAAPDDPAGHFVRGFATWLAAEVGDVEVLACRTADPLARLAAGGLPEVLRGRPDRALALSARLVAAALPRAHRWDAIVSHWLVPCGVLGVALARGRRHLAIAHGSDVALLKRTPGGPSVVRAIARQADLVYVADALRVPGAPGRVVAMPAEHAASPRSDDDRRRARHRLGLAPLGEGPLVALFLGRLVHEKGLDLLLDALPEGVRLLVAGDGPERATLRRHPAVQRGAARLLGTVLGADKRDLLDAADLLVVPSRRDGSPTVVAEGRARGLAILATRVGGLPGLVGPGSVLVEPSVGALSDALSSWAIGVPPGAEMCGWKQIGPRLWGPTRTLRFSNNIEVIKY